MTQKIVIAGSGFAGFWAAVSAMRAINIAGKHDEIEVLMVSPTPTVTIRPRLYEAVLENMNPDISAQLAAVGVAPPGRAGRTHRRRRQNAHGGAGDGGIS